MTETTIHSAFRQASEALIRGRGDVAAYALVVIPKNGPAIWEEHKCHGMEDRMIRALVQVAASIARGEHER